VRTARMAEDDDGEAFVAGRFEPGRGPGRGI
jgi:hypothetical protein